MKQIITLTLCLLVYLSGISQTTIFTNGFEIPIEQTDWTTGMSISIQDAPSDYPGDLDPWEMWDITTEPAYINSGNSAGFIGGTLTLEDKYDWLVSPEFLVPMDSNTSLNYWMWYQSSLPSNWTWLYIMVYDVSVGTWEIGELILHEQTVYSYYDEEYSFNLSAWEGKDVKIAFVKRGTYQFALDDVSCITVNNGNDLSLMEILTPTNGDGCVLTAAEEVKIKLKNTGTTDINAFEVKYTINNGMAVVETVTQQINIGETFDYTFIEKADLSEYGEYTIDVEAIVQDDQNASNDFLSTDIQSKDAEILIELKTDGFPGDNSWMIVDENNNIIAANGFLEKETLYYDTVCVMADGCYTFTLLDTYGDGMSVPPGFLNVYYNGVLAGGFIENDSNFGSQFIIDSIGDGCAIADVNTVSKEIVKAYPNPVSDILYLENLEGDHSIRIFDVLGREFNAQVNNDGRNTTVDFSHLVTGLYLVKVTSPNRTYESILIQKR